MPTPDTIKVTEEILSNMQMFNVRNLARGDLGPFNFNQVIEPAKKLIALYNKIPTNILDNISEQQLNTIKSKAEEDLNKFQEVLDFDVTQTDPSAEHKRIIEQFNTIYDKTFNAINSVVSYAQSSAINIDELNERTQISLKNLESETQNQYAELKRYNDEAQKLLTEIRKVSAEKGVSQQADFFKNRADEHEEQADKWKEKVYIFAAILAAYSILSLFLHQWFKPANTYETVQLAVSKVLIFAVISYLLYLSARNFIGHTHNTIINRHRQTALMTYKAIVGATEENKEIVLTHASACIFSPQPTGYSSEHGPDSPSAKSVIELLAKPLSSNQD